PPDNATTAIYTLSLHDALPIYGAAAATPADDMFAVGVLVHEMLTGHPPAPESEPLEEVRSVPPWLAELERRCLATDPASRWPDRSEEHTSELQSRENLVCRLLL